MALFSTRKIKNQDSQAPTTSPLNLKAFEKFYESNFDKPVKLHSRTVVISLILAIAFGFFAGLLAVFLFFSGFFSQIKLFSWFDINTLFPAANIVIEKQEKTIMVEEDRLSEANLNVSEVVVGIFSAKSSTGNYQRDVYSAKDYLASGLILTSDGWLATAGKINPAEKYLVFDQNGKDYQVKNIIQDNNLGLTYLKITADNLPVVSLLKLKEVKEGDKIIVVSGLENFNKKIALSIIKNNHLILTENAFWKTEKNYIFLEVDNLFSAQNFLSAPVFNFNKEALGLILETSAGKPYILPIDYFKKSFNQLLALKNTTPTYLGVEYLDLASNLLIGYGHQGALVTNLDIASPLKSQGVIAGDIILKVDENNVDGETNLSNLIQNYRPGDSIKLLILDKKTKNEKTVSVELK